MDATRIDYPKHWFGLLAIVIESILVYLFLAALLDEDSIWREFWLVACPVLGALLFVFLVPPIFTNHSIDTSALRLRMGLLMDTSIPLRSISAVKESSMTRGGLRIGIGTRYVPIRNQLFVTSGFSNLVSLKLAKPIYIGRLRKHPVEEVIINVSYPRGLIDAIEKPGLTSGK